MNHLWEDTLYLQQQEQQHFLSAYFDVEDYFKCIKCFDSFNFHKFHNSTYEIGTIVIMPIFIDEKTVA